MGAMKEPSPRAGSSPDPDNASTMTSSKKRKSALEEIEVDLALPEPPSKKARRALKKGKPLPTSKQSKSGGGYGLDSCAGDGDDRLPQQLKNDSNNKGAKKERSQHGIWIGNLPFTVSRADLFKWLVDSSGGAIAEDAITRVNLPLSKDKKPSVAKRRRSTDGKEGDGDGTGEATITRDNKGFAYVDFANYEACVAAMALSECDLGGRKVLIKDSKSFEGRPSGPPAISDSTAANNVNLGAADGSNSNTNAQRASSNNTNRKIYVGNLSFQTDEDELRSHFEKCGTIEWVKVATFEDSGKCKGYGWVKFAEPAAAEWAVKGFIKIREEMETEEDFLVHEENPDGDEGGKRDGEKKNKMEQSRRKDAPTKTTSAAEKKFKTRKWWVNMLKGRTLTIQMAEDDQVRYKKRFRKDSQQKPTKRTGCGPSLAERSKKKATGDQEPSGPVTAGPVPVPKVLSYHSDINVARLTGAAVAPQGKKVTFD